MRLQHDLNVIRERSAVALSEFLKLKLQAWLDTNTDARAPLFLFAHGFQCSTILVDVGNQRT